MLRSAILLAALLAAAPAVACPGDCDGDGKVLVNELVTGVGIALGQTAVAACPALDGNGDGQVTIAELIAATNALLSGCPAATPSPTLPPTASPSPTPTTVANRPPTLPTPFVYRGFVGAPIARPLDASDPEGDPVSCAAEALLAGMSLDPDNVLRWTPTEAQYGLADVPVRCQDAAQPPLAVDGDLAFRIAPRDACATPVCDAASGCTATLSDLGRPCCDGAEVPRLPEAEVLCPRGRLLLVGRNADGFGSLQHCDHLRFLRSAQTSGSLRIHVRVSCLNTLNRVTIQARLESATLGLLIDDSAQQARVFFAASAVPGFAERRSIVFPFTKPGPYLLAEEQEADLTVTATDSDGATASTTLRVILTSDSLLPDLPDL
ncbi:MAG: hypothetical protein U0802_15375 [Candidatus Binatia bacterium]